MSKEKSVAIRIKPGTRDFLKAIGRKGETYDRVINRLFNELKTAESYIYRPTDWAEYEKKLKKEVEV